MRPTRPRGRRRLPRVVEASPLAERLSETIEGYCEANKVSWVAVVEALDYVKACVERYANRHIKPGKLN